MKAVLLTLKVPHICFTKATTKPSLTFWLQNGSLKYGFMAKVMSGAINACKQEHHTSIRISFNNCCIKLLFKSKNCTKNT